MKIFGHGRAAAPLALLTMISPLPAGVAPKDPPAVFHATWRAEPGQAVGIYGHGFGTSDAKKTGAEVIIDAMSTTRGRAKATRRLQLVNVRPNLIQGVLPKDLPPDVYTLWVKTAAGWAAAVVNRAEPWWLSERTAYAGQTIRVFGRNFLPPGRERHGPPATAAPARVRVVLVSLDGKTQLPARVAAATDWAIDFEVPAGGRPGTRFGVLVTNGAGGPKYGVGALPAAQAFTLVEGKPDPLGLGAAWASEIPWERRVDVKERGARGDGQADDTAALQKALDELGAAGGGVAELPAGSYRFSGLRLPARTVLLGQGRDLVRLVWDGAPGPNPAPTVGPANLIGGKQTLSHAGPFKLIYSEASAVGLARLTVENNAVRPANDTHRRIGGYAAPVVFAGAPEPAPPSRGQFLKDVRLRNVDGGGAQLGALSDVIVEDCDIDVTHGPLELGRRAEGFQRIVGNTLRNTQRVGILGAGNRAVIERNTLVGAAIARPPGTPDPTGTSEHRVTDLGPEMCYVAHNRVDGTWGKPNSNEGEGICWQPIARLAYSRVQSADPGSLTDGAQAFAPDDLKDAKVTIVAGRGLGQMRAITGNSATRLTLDAPWQVVPDATSLYTIDRHVTRHNLIVDNEVVGKVHKGGIVLYGKNYDNVVAGNTLRNTGGIWLTATQVAGARRADFSYFAYAAHNRIYGAATPPSEGNRKGNHVTIGSAADGGVAARPDPALPSVGIYGSEIRGNLLVGIGTTVPFSSQYNDNFVKGSGIFVSSSAPEPPAGPRQPMAQGLIIEDNRVTNTVAGVHLGSTSWDTLLRGNDFAGNGVAVDDDRSVRTIRLAGATAPGPARDAAPGSGDPFRAHRTGRAPKIVRTLGEETGNGVLVRRVVFHSRLVPAPGGPQASEIFAAIARPARPGRYPGLLFLHGGGGSAEVGRAERWAARGYVVVTPDLPGIANPEKVPHSSGPWKSHAYGKNRWTASPDATASTLFDGVLAALQALYLLRAQPQVLPDRVGVTGVSWGGYAATMVAGLAGRDVRAAFSVYGSGFYDTDSTFKKELDAMAPAERDAWLRALDAGRRAGDITARYFLAAATNDNWFYPPAVAATLAAIPGPANHVFAPNANHAGPIPGGSADPTERAGYWAMEEPYFAFHLKGEGQPFPRITAEEATTRSDGRARVRFRVQAPAPVASVQVFYSLPEAPWPRRKWTPLRAEALGGDHYEATIPAEAAGRNADWFALVSDARLVSVSSRMGRCRP